jgi:hypothetical protein
MRGIMNDVKNRLEPSTVSRVLAVLSVSSCIWLLASTIGCGADRSRDPVEIAQIAVRANPSLELIATDERQGVLTVRVKRTGQILTVHAADVTAGTAFRDLESSTGAPSASSVSASGSSVSGSSTTMSAGPGPRSAGAASRTEAGRTEVASAGHRDVIRETTGGVRVVTDSATGRVSITTPTARVVAGGTQVAAGTGQSLPPEAKSEKSEEAASPSAAQSAQSGPGAHIDESRLERRTRGVVCVGSQGVQLEGVLLRVEDAAIQVTGPCKITIRNSHIAGEIAVQMTGSGVVTVDNSIIEGRSAAFQLAGDAVVEVRASTVRGAVQSVQNAKVRDQGGNLWK